MSWRTTITGALFLATTPTLPAAFDAAPDTLVLKDGREVHGLIVRNTVDAVLLQEQHVENLYPKSEIVRIRDEADDDAIFTDVLRRGTLPSWRVLANDFRTHDAIRSLTEIPATTIDVGEFRNVPYKSFRINDNVELNIYGDPSSPAGLELGIYGRHANDTKLQKQLRGYLAGYLTSRAEVAALYNLDLAADGTHRAGNLVFEITQPSAADAYGAWWVSIYNPTEIDAIRLTDAEYARITHPAEEIIDANGRLKPGSWSDENLDDSERLDAEGPNAAVLARGFYRDENGDFRLITK